MKRIVDIGKERQDYNIWPVLYPYMAFISAIQFCRKFFRSIMARVGKIKSNHLHHSPDHHMEE